MSYIHWNKLIAKHFFYPEMAGRDVLLFVDEHLINELGKSLGQDMQGFISSVIEGPFKVKSDPSLSVCQKALRVYENWRDNDLKYPPYLAYLALFVLAGCIDDGYYSPIAYYPKLRKLLGEEEVLGQYPRFDEMYRIWQDLEKWTKEDKFEEFGRFTVKTRGRWRHVGLPLSQSVLSAKEKRSLPLLFHKGGLIPTSPPYYNQLKNMLIEHGQNNLSRKTLRLLYGEEENKELLMALLDYVRDELIHWDGSLPEETMEGSVLVRSTAMLCLDLDKIKKKARFSLRVKANNPFPDESLRLGMRGKTGAFTCKDSIQNWSTEIKDDQNHSINIKHFDFRYTVFLDDSENGWSVKFPGNTVRIFTRGQKLGLPNAFVEIHQLERGSQFLLLCHQSVIDEIAKWGKQACADFGPIVYGGLPTDWSLFQGVNPELSCEGFEVLALSSQTSIRFFGGIRLGYGNTFLNFSPPNVIVENPEGNVVMNINDLDLIFDLARDCWVLPQSLPTNVPLTIQVKGLLEGPKKIVFKLIEPVINIKNYESYLKETKLQIDSNVPMAIGGNIYNQNDRIEKFEFDIPIHLSNEIIFIGKGIGQICYWLRSSQKKIAWSPVWAIAKEGRKKWKLYFCGIESLQRSKPGNVTGNSKEVEQWKAAIRGMTKIIEKPSFEFEAFNKLWDDYLEVSKNG
ncbi:hypothetical protein SAMN04487897_11751 [Paenibacillus sp. yr247]|uniref:hypothetical protein n=1 Tax=Paenibacillus sp. yr247 TaxID=1761880 RepID=UPI00088B1D5C|nr:hypothetical protein [Paenibacillus sp. yr247]SDO58435.1 hypothetical protein SAMN04487897_11751 [Paenibacillus sp. yr247]